MLIRQAALAWAATKLGIVEKPPFSNRGHAIDLWNTAAGAPLGSPYCCSFVHTAFKKQGFDLPGGASVALVLAGARARGWLVQRPRRGDLVCFDFGTGKYGPYGDHIGMVERVLALRWSGGVFVGWIQTVEANTSAQGDWGGSQSNGGGVFRRRRWIRAPIAAKFVRVPGNVN